MLTRRKPNSSFFKLLMLNLIFATLFLGCNVSSIFLSNATNGTPNSDNGKIPGGTGAPTQSTSQNEGDKEYPPVDVAGVHLTSQCVDPNIPGLAENTALIECSLRSNSDARKNVHVSSVTMSGIREGEQFKASDFTGTRHPVAGFFVVTKTQAMSFYFEVPNADLPAFKEKLIRLEFGEVIVDWVKYEGQLSVTLPIGTPLQLAGISSLSFDMNDASFGSVPAPLAGKVGQILKVADNTDLQKIGFLLGGWSTSADGTGKIYSAGDPFKLSGDSHILYAVWIKPPTYYVNDDSTQGDRFATAVGNDAVTNDGKSPDKPFRTIQKAIDVASAGDVIQVDAGQYENGCINIHKQVELRGPNWDVSPTWGARRAEATINPRGIGCGAVQGYTDHISITSPNVTILGFSFTNPTNTPSSTKAGLIMAGRFQSHNGDPNNIRIEKNIFSNLWGNAIATTNDIACIGPCWTIVDNKIQKIRPALGQFGGDYATAIQFGGSGEWVVARNFIEDVSADGNPVSARGISAFLKLNTIGPTSAKLDISGNYISQVQHSAIRVELDPSLIFASTVNILGNAVLSANTQNATDGTAGGIHITETAPNTVNPVLIRRNYVANTSPALLSELDLSNRSPSNFFVEENSFLNFTGLPIVQKGSGTLQALRNWFGFGIPCSENLSAPALFPGVHLSPESLSIAECLSAEP